VTVAAAEGSHRALILAHLADHPDLTARELARALGITSRLQRLLLDMETKAEVISVTEWRPSQGRRVSLWRLAPPGTVPLPQPAPSPEAVRHRQERDRLSQRRRRARARGASVPPGDEIPVIFNEYAPATVPPGGACEGADPALFFPSPDEPDAPAKAICATCRIRPQCYAAAVANGEEAGIWGGVNFETQQKGRRAS
jgi:WhiB family transcriptional regulator, redox-sensing transcriptional regulator